MPEEKTGSAARASPGSDCGPDCTSNDINHHHNSSCTRYGISGKHACSCGEGNSEALAFHAKAKRLERIQEALGQESNEF
jgi:hypothetical protein